MLINSQEFRDQVGCFPISILNIFPLIKSPYLALFLSAKRDMIVHFSVSKNASLHKVLIQDEGLLLPSRSSSFSGNVISSLRAVIVQRGQEETFSTQTTNKLHKNNTWGTKSSIFSFFLFSLLTTSFLFKRVNMFPQT